jgi:hypothetical protein
MKYRKVKQVLSGIGTSERGEGIREGQRRANMVEVLCIHI